jgi:hypothetical protein
MPGQYKPTAPHAANGETDASTDYSLRDPRLVEFDDAFIDRLVGDLNQLHRRLSRVVQSSRRPYSV